jgi:hypothetical protein
MRFSSMLKAIALTLLSVPLVPTAACNGDSVTGPDAGSMPNADSGATFSCDSTSKCPNDPPTNKAPCEQNLTGPCGARFRAFSQCALEKQQCGADGRRTTPSSKRTARPKAKRIALAPRPTVVSATKAGAQEAAAEVESTADEGKRVVA